MTLFPLEDLSIYEAIGKVKDFKVELCERDKVDAFVRHWHYSNNVQGLTIDYSFRLLDGVGKLIGAMMYGKIAMANVWKSYVKKETDLIELRRLCCIDNTPRNTESYFIGATLKWLRKNTDFKVVLSYADTTHGHAGTIYKASNFKHVGMTQPGKVIEWDGRTYHDRSLRDPAAYAKKLVKALSEGKAQWKETGSKHIYLYNL